MTPIVETLLPETDIEDICNVIDRIGKEYHKKAKGLAKHKVYNEFVKILEEDQRLHCAQLNKIKKIDADMKIQYYNRDYCINKQ